MLCATCAVDAACGTGVPVDLDATVDMLKNGKIKLSNLQATRFDIVTTRPKSDIIFFLKMCHDIDFQLSNLNMYFFIKSVAVSL